jgi:AraC-like DNA-binding protein
VNEPAAWRSTHRAPAASLAGLVLRLWDLEGSAPPSIEREAPRGDVSLIVNLAGHHSAPDRGDPTLWRTFPEAWVMGLHERHATVAGGGGPFHLCGARLTPEGGRALLAVSPAQLANCIVSLDEVLGGVPVLVDRLRTARSSAQRFAVLESFLGGRAAAGHAWSAELRWAVEQTQAHAGGLAIAALAREIGWSRRRLHRTFVEQVGIAPKSFARVARFHAARGALDAGPVASLADVAHAFGYADQAHFAREFGQLAGVTPGAYLRRRPGSAAGFVQVD